MDNQDLINRKFRIKFDHARYQGYIYVGRIYSQYDSGTEFGDILNVHLICGDKEPELKMLCRKNIGDPLEVYTGDSGEVTLISEEECDAIMAIWFIQECNTGG